MPRFATLLIVFKKFHIFRFYIHPDIMLYSKWFSLINANEIEMSLNHNESKIVWFALKYCIEITIGVREEEKEESATVIIIRWWGMTANWKAYIYVCIYEKASRKVANYHDRSDRLTKLDFDRTNGCRASLFHCSHSLHLLSSHNFSFACGFFRCYGV